MKYFLLITLICLSACEIDSNTQQAREQERLNRQSNQDVGMPAITNFQEKRILKNILELRDTAIKTTTYTQDMNGRMIKGFE